MKRAHATATTWTPPATLAVQRKCACGTHVPGGGHCTACAAAGHAVPLPSGGGRAIEPRVRAEMEAGFGRSFAGVRVHDRADSHAAARDMDARAFTVGQAIHFAAGEYAPSLPGGKRLLAHELAHTVQQRGLSGGVQRVAGHVADVGPLEAEADRAAAQVLAGGTAQVTGAAGMLAPQRQAGGATAAPPKVVPPVTPTAKQQGVIDTARKAAAIRTQIARFRASGIEGAAQAAAARALAKIKFVWADPNMEQIDDILAGMGGGLISVSVQVGGAGDSECRARGGYVRDHRAPIVLCPAFFTSGPEQQIRTMIHEMAHVKGIGKADVTEGYFMTFDCTEKGDFTAADSWANYVHCLSGQTPDKPDDITGKAPAKGATP
ncbi:DUF4157 domain-containing protein [Sphingomonas sp. LR60]|uniref:eCIS core domain-containing protein n=1 Tax=Sphingomonas sp. LR60 TaxID=3050233 RepID=UPI002FE33637